MYVKGREAWLLCAAQERQEGQDNWRRKQEERTGWPEIVPGGEVTQVDTFLSSPVLSCHVYPVLSCPVVFVLFWPDLSWPVLSWPILFCAFLSYPVLSCPVMSILFVQSYPDLSNPILCCPVCPIQSCPVLYYPIWYKVVKTLSFPISSSFLRVPSFRPFTVNEVTQVDSTSPPAVQGPGAGRRRWGVRGGRTSKKTETPLWGGPGRGWDWETQDVEPARSASTDVVHGTTSCV